ncbi:MAG: hypothetical protein IH945_02135 [Armatimonadetes bacterium]|nr:hypothetical protein [Armatimonadota bacterium]
MTDPRKDSEKWAHPDDPSVTLDQWLTEQGAEYANAPKAPALLLIESADGSLQSAHKLKSWPYGPSFNREPWLPVIHWHCPAGSYAAKVYSVEWDEARESKEGVAILLVRARPATQQEAVQLEDLEHDYS